MSSPTGPGNAVDGPTVTLTELPGGYAVCRLDPDSIVSLPAGGLCSLTRTPTELSLVCPEEQAAGTRVEPGWVALAVAGPLDFALTGILASLAGPLASAGISIFALSTYDTDYVLVRGRDRDRAVQVLRAAGHQVLTSP